MRSTPARRQRSVTPFDTFYTPYRGPCFDEPHSPSPPRKRGRPRKIPEECPRRPDAPRKRGRPRKYDHHRDVPIHHERRSPTPKKRGRPRKVPEPPKRPSPIPRRRGRPKKSTEPSRHRDHREPSPLNPRSEKSRNPKPRTRSRFSRSPTPKPRRRDYVSRSRSPSIYIEAHYKRTSRKDSPVRHRSIFDEDSSSNPVIQRGRSPWLIRRRAVSRPIDYASLRERTFSRYMTRSRSRALSPSPSPRRYNRSRTARSRSRSRSRDRTRRGSPISSYKRARSPTPYRKFGKSSSGRERRSQSRFYSRPSPGRC